MCGVGEVLKKSRSGRPVILGKSQRAWGEKTLKEEEEENRMTTVGSVRTTQTFWENKHCSETTVWTGFKQHYFSLAICSNKGSALYFLIHKQWQSGV